MEKEINKEKAGNNLKEIYESLDENERFGLSFGLFPVRLEELKLTNHESAALIGISQNKTGVEY